MGIPSACIQFLGRFLVGAERREGGYFLDSALENLTQRKKQKKNSKTKVVNQDCAQ